MNITKRIFPIIFFSSMEKYIYIVYEMYTNITKKFIIN